MLRMQEAKAKMHSDCFSFLLGFFLFSGCGFSAFWLLWLLRGFMWLLCLCIHSSSAWLLRLFVALRLWLFASSAFPVGKCPKPRSPENHKPSPQHILVSTFVQETLPMCSGSECPFRKTNQLAADMPRPVAPKFCRRYLLRASKAVRNRTNNMHFPQRTGTTNKCQSSRACSCSECLMSLQTGSGLGSQVWA